MLGVTLHESWNSRVSGVFGDLDSGTPDSEDSGTIGSRDSEDSEDSEDSADSGTHEILRF